MGGIVASRFAADHGNRTNGIVLIGPVDSSDAISGLFVSRIDTVKQGNLRHPPCLTWPQCSEWVGESKIKARPRLARLK
jgi:pimeloyl-ACP methyl ester carboxylesterase